MRTAIKKQRTRTTAASIFALKMVTAGGARARKRGPTHIAGANGSNVGDPPLVELSGRAGGWRRFWEIAKNRTEVSVIEDVRAHGQKSEKLTLPKLRVALGWSRNQLAHVLNASDRAIVNWEAGAPMSPVYAAKFREVQSIYNELKQMMKPEEIGAWLLTEMDEFEGRTPADLISKGETGRVWASLFYLRSGMPD